MFSIAHVWILLIFNIIGWRGYGIEIHKSVNLVKMFLFSFYAQLCFNIYLKKTFKRWDMNISVCSFISMCSQLISLFSFPLWKIKKKLNKTLQLKHFLSFFVVIKIKLSASSSTMEFDLSRYWNSVCIYAPSVSTTYESCFKQRMPQPGLSGW